MSEYKEIDECISELNDCYDELYKRFCEGTLCNECLLDEPLCDCLLTKLQDSIDTLQYSIDTLEEKRP